MLCLGRPLHNLSLQLPSLISSFFYFFYVRHSLSVFFFLFSHLFFSFTFFLFLVFFYSSLYFPLFPTIGASGSLSISLAAPLSLDLSAAQQRADGGAGPPWRRRGGGSGARAGGRARAGHPIQPAR